MKVLFVTRVPPEVIAWKAQNALPRVRHLPCELVECYSAEDVRNHIGTADVILLDNGYRYVPFWDEITFINTASLYTGRFHVDMWLPRESGTPATWNESSISFNVRIIAYRKLQKEYRPGWQNVFWSPHCIDAQHYDVLRDIDVLFWGACSPQYPFRQFVSQKLKECVVGNGVPIDPFLTMYDVVVARRKYKYGVVRFVSNPVDWQPPQVQTMYGYYGPRLFRLLSRARVCCTGPAWGVPVGKYIEHAACGAVSLTTDFSDREALGFSHEENIWVTDKRHFMGDLTHLLERDNVVQAISRNARELVETRHTLAIRARELYKFLCKATGKE